MQEKIFSILFDEDEINWKGLLYDLVKSEGMDPWDIDVSEISKKYLDMVKKLREMDLKMSGKVLLAAAILLKFKSNHLLSQGINNLDGLFAQSEQEEEIWEEVDGELVKVTPDRLKDYQNAELIPRTPQPRKRQVSIYDLVDALQQALEVRNRRVRRYEEEPMEIPEKQTDISQLMQELLSDIYEHFEKNLTEKLTFQQLVKDTNREAKVLTFIPLLHLTNQRKVDLDQKEHFGEIEIMLNKFVEEKEESKEEEKPAEA
ncbi:segregation/condensation protein A [Candidatus Woesearchaeota archaeon]|jgi:segregation and condensation protein A|nr:segregation/condensation protein A [Candidatus Woesearchaeota archaeon]MBT3538085.1 segregation/condensation protein A [Candidatus Woesearchaeota archaeon]MBT4697294.1 segregation/condensation protein A [Candidatus Woesearchaeota archaeon]MBT7105754.1 segregation/condensation protein A [Candidatus Woesearchaeota archaeon]MBT7930591.1 segregation/condensation protein A [Candidatus Woesearchaeota archaeon]